MSSIPTQEGSVHSKSLKGVILSGGRSKRFGKNKALEAIGSEPLIQRVMNTLKGVFKEILIITNEPQEYEFLGCEVKTDIIEGLGPLGGIYSALKYSEPFPVFVFACDMPDLNRSFIEHMCHSFDGEDILVPRIGHNMYEPLHAIYGPRCIPVIEELIGKGIFKVYHLFGALRVKYIDPPEITLFDPSFSCFSNINTKEDMETYLQKRKPTPIP